MSLMRIRAVKGTGPSTELRSFSVFGSLTERGSFRVMIILNVRISVVDLCHFGADPYLKSHFINSYYMYLQVRSHRLSFYCA